MRLCLDFILSVSLEKAVYFRFLGSKANDFPLKDTNYRVNLNSVLWRIVKMRARENDIGLLSIFYYIFKRFKVFS